jgi:hypothetical protein
MARRKKSITKRITHNRSIFSPGQAGRIDQYILANIITGLAIGAGSALATILIKSLLKYVDNTTTRLPVEIRSELYGEDKVSSQRSRR